VQRRDIKAVGALAGDASGVVTTLVRDMHAGIASRVFAAVGPPSRPTQIIHDGIALAVYAAVDTGCAGRPAWVAPLRLNTLWDLTSGSWPMTPEGSTWARLWRHDWSARGASPLAGEGIVDGHVRRRLPIHELG
jgi:hypothetical protein